MAREGESFIPDNDFGIISSNTTLADNIQDFFDAEDGEEIKVIKKRPEASIEEPKKEEKAKEVPEALKAKEKPAAKVLGEEELIGDDEEEGEEKSEEGKEEEEENPATLYNGIAEEMYNLGIFTEEDEEERELIQTPEQLRDRFILESKRSVGDVLDKFLNSKGQEARDLFDAVLVEGVDPKSYLEKFVSLQDFKSIDLTSESNQEKVVRELYKRQNRSGIDGKIEKLRNYGDLEEESKEAQQMLIAQDEKALEEEKTSKQQANTRKQEQKKHYVTNVSRILTDKLSKKEFDGIPVNKQFADEIASYLMQEKYETSKGEILTPFEKDMFDLNKPENYEMKVKLAMIYKMLQKDPTLSSLKRSAITNETNSLFGKVAKTVARTNNNKDIKKESKPTSSWFSE